MRHFQRRIILVVCGVILVLGLPALAFQQLSAPTDALSITTTHTAPHHESKKHPTVAVTASPVKGALEFLAIVAQLYPTTTTTTTLPPPTTTATTPSTFLLPPPTVASNLGIAPIPVSNERCGSTYNRPDIEALINRMFGPAGPWANSIVSRESNCIPDIANSEGCLGLFQLCGHGDLLLAVCPTTPDPGRDAICNTGAAKLLYNGSGIRPWRL